MLKRFSKALAIAILGIMWSGCWLWGYELSDIQASIEASGARWIAGETSMSRLEQDEMSMFLGALKPAITGTEDYYTPRSDRILVLPARFDWRNVGGDNFVTPVRNQANCGSCWAFATTAGLEAVTLIAQKTPGVNLNLAEEMLVRCSGAGSCAHGGYPGAASDFMRDSGLPVESCYPYTATDGSCSPACPDWQANSYRIQRWMYVATWSPTVDLIKNALYDYGPLPTTMDVYEDFRYYTGGIYSHVYGGLAGGHAVLIVGYDDEEQYFIVKNSWGTGWGESGYFRIDYSQLSNEVEFGYYTMAYETEADIKSRLRVLKTGTGKGEITGEGLICNGSYCEGEYLTGITLTVSAQAEKGYVLEEWIGCDEAISQNCRITLSHDMTVTAVFLPPPRMVLTPTVIKFGGVKTGSPSEPKQVVVQNTGTARLSLMSFEMGGTHSADFSIVSSCPAVLLSGESCSLAVIVNPSDYGKRSGELQVYSNDLTKQPHFAMKMTATGKTPKIKIRPSSLRFDPVNVGESLGLSAPKTVLVENRGYSDLVINSVVTENIGDFSLQNDCPEVLDVGASCLMEASFAPSGAGTRKGFATIYTNDPKRPSVTLKFTGKAVE